MILGVGIDLVSIARIKSLSLQFQKKFTEKIFTEKEVIQAQGIKILSKRNSFFAKRFAAKEALSKATGLGIGRGINFCDIEVENDQLGRPLIKIRNNKEEFLKNYFGCKEIAIHLSLSDEKDLAKAIVIIEKIS